MTHALTIVDRSRSRSRRYEARCACGWTSVSHRRRSAVEGEYRDHLRRVTKVPVVPVPAPVTAAERLPEVLR